MVWAKRIAFVSVALALVPAAPASGATNDRLKRQMTDLLRVKGGPPGVIVTIRRGRQTRILSGGRGLIGSDRRPRFRDHMRLASVAKAFSGAVALRLVGDRKLSLNDTVGKLRPDLPRAWHGVTVRRMLNHTSGLPDYTKSQPFFDQLERDPGGFVPPSEIISWVAGEPLDFPPGARYGYSNTDNIVIGLIAEKVTGRSYGSLLRSFVFRRLRPQRHQLPHRHRAAGALHPRLQRRGRRVLHRHQHADQRLGGVGLGRGGVHAEGPGAFIRGNLGGRLFPRRLRRDQLRFVRGGNVRPTRAGQQLGGPGHLQLPHQVRDDVRPHRQLPGLRAVRCGLSPRDALGHLVDQRGRGPRSAASCSAKLRAMQRTLVCEALK